MLDLEERVERLERDFEKSQDHFERELIRLSTAIMETEQRINNRVDSGFARIHEALDSRLQLFQADVKEDLKEVKAHLNRQDEQLLSVSGKWPSWGVAILTAALSFIAYLLIPVALKKINL